jgi:hypothetical protein
MILRVSMVALVLRVFVSVKETIVQAVFVEAARTNLIQHQSAQLVCQIMMLPQIAKLVCQIMISTLIAKSVWVV